MCGISGYLDARGFSRETACSIAQQMARRLAHRGPDDHGVWVDPEAGVAMSHRRLSILDLSAAGHQPMASPSGRYIIVLNGEAYNHKDLREELNGSFTWRGHSDTETLTAGFDRWGIESTLKRTVGMFALAVWDLEARVLTLARDRMGEKPLYYGWHGDNFIFASELKAMRAHPEFRDAIDRDSLALYLRYGYIPAPFSIFQNTRKLLPGTFVQIERGRAPGHLPEPSVYWSLSEAVRAGRLAEFRGSFDDAVEELEARLSKAVSIQRIADVPLGAFLSGGIDSSTVVALMQSQSSTPVKTFTIGFHEQGYNEAEYAKSVAQHLGTSHTELYVTPGEAMTVIPQLPQFYDEPFGDSSSIPTFLVSKLARQHVTVSLSGDGGDELFYGYRKYPRTAKVLSRFERIPSGVRQLSAIAANGLRYGLVPFRRIAPSLLKAPQLEAKAMRLAEVLGSESIQFQYRCLVSHWNAPTAVVRDSFEPLTPFVASEGYPDHVCAKRAMMYLDSISSLPEDILTKVDRAAMTVSLETRLPMLDHRVVEFAQTLPLAFLDGDGRGKLILRRLLAKYIPDEMINRPKRGFAVPIDRWLKGPLREWAEDLIDVDSLRRDGFFDPTIIERKWREYRTGSGNWESQLWDVLMFQAWWRSFQSESAVRTIAS